MSHGYLHTMLDMLTGAYNRDDVRNAYSSLPLETNIGRLFNTLAWGLELIHDQSDKILLWDDLDNAQGAVLDRYGENFGVARDGAPDAFYRLLIKVKMISLLSGGDPFRHRAGASRPRRSFPREGVDICGRSGPRSRED